MSFVVDEVLLEQVLVKILRSALVTIIPLMLDTRIPFTEDLSCNLRVLNKMFAHSSARYLILVFTVAHCHIQY